MSSSSLTTEKVGPGSAMQGAKGSKFLRLMRSLGLADRKKLLSKSLEVQTNKPGTQLCIPCLSSRAWVLQEDVLSQRILRYSRDQLFWACRTLFHSERNPTDFNSIQEIFDARNFRRQAMSEDVGVYQDRLLTFWYNILRRYQNQSFTFENDRFPAISGMAREIGSRGNCTYKAGIWKEDAHRGLLWWTVRTTKRHSQYIAPSWSWTSLICRKSDFNGKFYDVAENLAKIVHIDVTTVGDDVYGQVSPASLKIQSQWRSMDPWEEQAESPSRKSTERIQIYFDLAVARRPRGSGQDIICI